MDRIGPVTAVCQRGCHTRWERASCFASIFIGRCHLVSSARERVQMHTLIHAHTYWRDDVFLISYKTVDYRSVIIFRIWRWASEQSRQRRLCISLAYLLHISCMYQLRNRLSHFLVFVSISSSCFNLHIQNGLTKRKPLRSENRRSKVFWERFPGYWNLKLSSLLVKRNKLHLPSNWLKTIQSHSVSWKHAGRQTTKGARSWHDYRHRNWEVRIWRHPFTIWHRFVPRERNYL